MLFAVEFGRSLQRTHGWDPVVQKFTMYGWDLNIGKFNIIGLSEHTHQDQLMSFGLSLASKGS